MAKPQKRQKSLLGYFSLSVPSKPNQTEPPAVICTGVLQTQHNSKNAFTAETEAVSVSVAADTIVPAERPNQQPNSQADIVHLSSQLSREDQPSLPVEAAAESSRETTSSSSPSSIIADEASCSGAPEETAINQYEQQVQSSKFAHRNGLQLSLTF